jgi:pimeloyl-ACP methyl ester carboxylesterase
MPRGRFIGYEGVGHAPFLEAPDRFAADLADFVTMANKEAMDA